MGNFLEILDAKTFAGAAAANAPHLLNHEGVQGLGESGFILDCLDARYADRFCNRCQDILRLNLLVQKAMGMGLCDEAPHRRSVASSSQVS